MVVNNYNSYNKCNTLLFMKDTLLIVAAIILAGAMIGGAIIYSNQNIGKNIAADIPSGGVENGEKNDGGGSLILSVSEDNDAFKGSPDAPVVIVEFSDFECPFCATFYGSVMKQIEEDYIDTGKVKLVYRDFPLPFHSKAQKAAEAAECAYEQNNFWGMHDIIFENQDAIDISDLKKYAVSLGLDSELFNGCLDSGHYADEVQKDFQYADNIGVTGTPTFFINGEKIVGAQPYSVFKSVIDKKLAEANR
jgi:protein-disulfide isomerase